MNKNTIKCAFLVISTCIVSMVLQSYKLDILPIVWNHMDGQMYGLFLNDGKNLSVDVKGQIWNGATYDKSYVPLVTEKLRTASWPGQVGDGFSKLSRFSTNRDSGWGLVYIPLIFSSELLRKKYPSAEWVVLNPDKPSSFKTSNGQDVQHKTIIKTEFKTLLPIKTYIIPMTLHPGYQNRKTILVAKYPTSPLWEPIIYPIEYTKGEINITDVSFKSYIGDYVRKFDIRNLTGLSVKQLSPDSFYFFVDVSFVGGTQILNTVLKDASLGISDVRWIPVDDIMSAPAGKKWGTEGQMFEVSPNLKKLLVP